MQNFDKTYPDRIEVANQFENFVPQAKDFFRRLLPLVVKFSIAGVVLLILQALFVGITDRLGFSPKTSFLVSSLFYTATFGTLAVFGGSKIANKSANIFKFNGSAPICKMLIIRKKGEQN